MRRDRRFFSHGARDAVWYGAWFVLGCALWVFFLNGGDIPFDFHDWAEVNAPRLAFVQDALRKGVFPLHMPEWFTPEGYSGVVLKTWGVKVVGDGLLGSPPGAAGGAALNSSAVISPSPPGAAVGSGAAGSAGRASGAVRAASGVVPAPHPRFASITHLAWWNGVSHVVTHPGPRAPGVADRKSVV